MNMLVWAHLEGPGSCRQNKASVTQRNTRVREIQGRRTGKILTFSLLCFFLVWLVRVSVSLL